jgi:hypothetical protein
MAIESVYPGPGAKPAGDHSGGNIGSLGFGGEGVPFGTVPHEEHAVISCILAYVSVSGCSPLPLLLFLWVRTPCVHKTPTLKRAQRRCGLQPPREGTMGPCLYETKDKVCNHATMLPYRPKYIVDTR